jgi:FkbM family methyltransferase
MLITDRLSSSQDSVSIDSLLLKEAKGMTLIDKLVLFSLKNIYLASRAASKIALGKRKRDRLYSEREISLKNFMYKSVKFLGVGNLRLKVNVPEYGYHVYCRSEDNFNDLAIMIQHEHDLLERFSPKEGDVVVDIGAHMGRYTIISSKRVGTNGKVICMEADPNNFETLNHSIELNNLTNVISFNCITYSKEMDIVDVNTYNRMHVNTLDYLLHQNGISHAEVNWMKIDVEGAELEVLKGATNILSKSKDIALLIEIHGISSLYKPIMELLNSYNFKIEKAFEGYQRQNMMVAKNIIPESIIVRKSSY